MITSSTQAGVAPRLAQLLRFEAGDTIYHEGDPASAWYAVAEGAVRTCRFYADGHRQVTGFHYAADVFGVDAEVHIECAEAITAVSLWCYPGGIVDLGASPGHREKGLRIALRNAQLSIAIFGRRTAPEKIAAFLLSTAERIGSAKPLLLPMCRTDIADFLGLTIHTVSRTFTQLCDEGLIALEGAQRCRLTDLPRLRKLAGESD